MKLTYNNYQNWRKQNQLWEMIDSGYRGIKGKHEVFLKKIGRNPLINNLWWELGRDFSRIFGKGLALRKFYDLNAFEEILYPLESPVPYVYIHTVLDLFSVPEIQFTIRFLQYRDSENYGMLRDEQYFSLVPDKNMELTEENIVKFVKAYINKEILYAEGKFREAQISNCLSKNLLKACYKENSKNKIDRLAYDEEATNKSIQRHLNIKFEHCEDIDFIRKSVNQIGRSNIGKALKEPKQFDFNFYSFNCEGDIDEIEEMFWEEIANQSEDCILVY